MKKFEISEEQLMRVVDCIVSLALPREVHQVIGDLRRLPEVPGAPAAAPAVAAEPGSADPPVAAAKPKAK